MAVLYLSMMEGGWVKKQYFPLYGTFQCGHWLDANNSLGMNARASQIHQAGLLVTLLHELSIKYI